MLHYFLHPSAGVALVLFAAIVGIVAMLHTPRAEAERPAPDHICVVDLDRSTVAVHDDNTITATCAVAGCHRVTVLGHNVARAYMVVS